MNHLTYSVDDICFCNTNKTILAVENLVINGVPFGSFKKDITQDTFLTELTSKMNIPLRIKSDSEVIKEIQNNVQELLDDIAKEKNYDNGFALASYSDSSNEKFQHEAMQFIAYRDQCWLKCYELLDQYEAGEIERPDPDLIYDYLPTFRWIE